MANFSKRFKSSKEKSENISADFSKKSQNQFGLNPRVGRTWRNKSRCYPSSIFPTSMTWVNLIISSKFKCNIYKLLSKFHQKWNLQFSQYLHKIYLWKRKIPFERGIFHFRMLNWFMMKFFFCERSIHFAFEKVIQVWKSIFQEKWEMTKFFQESENQTMNIPNFFKKVKNLIPRPAREAKPRG